MKSVFLPTTCPPPGNTPIPEETEHTLPTFSAYAPLRVPGLGPLSNQSQPIPLASRDCANKASVWARAGKEMAGPAAIAKVSGADEGGGVIPN